MTVIVEWFSFGQNNATSVIIMLESKDKGSCFKIDQILKFQNFQCFKLQRGFLKPLEILISSNARTNNMKL